MGDAGMLEGDSLPAIEDVEVDSGIVVLLARVFLIFGGVAPYIPQYLQIMNTNDASGFSTYVCLVILFSNVLRIAYWFGHWFDNALLLQSVVMNAAMFALLELCLRTQRNRAAANGIPYQESKFRDFRADKFWKWTDLWSYIQATIILLIISTIYTSALSGKDVFIEPIGFIALLVESTLAMPQFVKNYQARSTNGMNVYMVILWAIGDGIKGFFFYHTKQPLPFQLCAIIQLAVDAALFYQVGTYDQ